MGVAGLLLGIIGVVFGWIPVWNYIVLPLSILGIVLSVIGRKKAAANGKSGGVATAGLVFSIIGTVCSGIGVIACTLCAAGVAQNTGSLSETLDSLRGLSDSVQGAQQSTQDTLDSLRELSDSVQDAQGTLEEANRLLENIQSIRN